MTVQLSTDGLLERPVRRRRSDLNAQQPLRHLQRPFTQLRDGAARLVREDALDDDLSAITLGVTLVGVKVNTHLHTLAVG